MKNFKEFKQEIVNVLKAETIAMIEIQPDDDWDFEIIDDMFFALYHPPGCKEKAEQLIEDLFGGLL